MHRALIVIAILWLGLQCDAAFAGAGIEVQNNLPKDSPCPDDLDKADYAELLAGATKAAGRKVVDAINKQIEGEREKAKAEAKTIKVEITIVKDAKAFLDLYNANQDTKNQWDAATANDKFNNLNGFTFTTMKAPPPAIKIVVFCKQSVRMAVKDGKAARLIVHELVHAKLFAMGIMGIEGLSWNDKDDADWKKKQEDDRRTSQTEDHNADFNKHVNDLMKLID
jgi:Ni,Fe-hydrogenase III component G